MNCRKVKKILSSAIEQGSPLDPKVAEHLKDCVFCRVEKANLEKIWGLLDSYETPKASADFTSKLVAGIQTEKPAPAPIQLGSRLKRWRMVSALAASVVIVIILCVLWVRPMFRQEVAQVEPIVPGKHALAMDDEAIIRDLEVYENLDMLQNMALLSEYEVIDELGDTLEEEENR